MEKEIYLGAQYISSNFYIKWVVTEILPPS